MSLYDRAHMAARRLGLAKTWDLSEYNLPTGEAESISPQSTGALAELFYGNTGRLAHKWAHYLDAYDRYFSTYRGTAVHMLEIGVFGGGSLAMWRKYFGADATIYGVDLNPECATRADPPTQVRIGSQDDPAFLRGVAAEMGELDIVLDDGSHIGRHQEASFRTLFPLLKNGGIYAIEDLHTAYWPGEYEGGYGRAGTGIEFVKQMIDDMHSSYHDKGSVTGAGDWIAAMHVYDSLVFIEKREKRPPRHIQIGQGAA